MTEKLISALQKKERISEIHIIPLYKMKQNFFLRTGKNIEANEIDIDDAEISREEMTSLFII